MNPIHNAGGLPIDPQLNRQTPIRNAGNASFSDLLQQLQNNRDLHFSAHAQNRLQARDIQLSEASMSKLTDAVNRAAAKGARDALILMPGAASGQDLALLVSVANRTVITAVDGEHIKNNVFTNIDSAVIAT
jgi:flagellar operon protein